MNPLEVCYHIARTEEFTITNETVTFNMPFAGDTSVRATNVMVVWSHDKKEFSLSFRTKASNLRLPHAEFNFGNVDQEGRFNFSGNGPDVRWKLNSVKTGADDIWTVVCDRIVNC